MHQHEYRPEIDGLRAIAVMAVLLFHIGGVGVTGGYVGVDIFFVISGYLITGHVVSEVANGKFSFRQFYIRRIKRLYPALIFYVAVAFLIAAIISPPHQTKEFGQSVVANILLSANIFFYYKTDYFNDMSEVALLLHTWSLAVEEQYYLLAPLAIFLISKFFNRFDLALWMIFIMALIVGIAAAVDAQQNSPTAAFYLLQYRYWELLTGGCAALFGMRLPGVTHRVRLILGSIGFLIAIIPCFIYQSTTPFPGVAAVPVVAGTVLMLIFIREGDVFGRVLSSLGVRWIGIISYSLYLAHNIVFAGMRTYGVDLHSFQSKAVAVIVTFTLASLSYKYIESPLRKTKDSKLVLQFVVFSFLAFCFLGYFFHKTEGLKEWKFGNLSEAQRIYIIDYEKTLVKRKEFWSSVLIRGSSNFDESTQRKVLIVGDSKSEDLYVSVSNGVFSATQFRWQRLDDPCMSPSVIFDSLECRETYEAFFADSKYKEADEVVLSATWQFETNTKVVDLINRLIRERKKVSIVSTSNFNDVSSLSYAIALNPNVMSNNEGRYFYQNIRLDWMNQYKDLTEKIRAQGLPVRFLEKEEVFCSAREQSCILREGTKWYIYDSGHLTEEGAIFFSHRIKELEWFE